MTNFEWWAKQEILLKSKTPKQMMTRLRKLHYKKEHLIELLDDCLVATVEALESMSCLEICTKYHDEIAIIVAEDLLNGQ